MGNVRWYFSQESDPDDQLVDSFADSKFDINRWNSFAREIIQNSLDAQDDINNPVEVKFDLNKDLTLDDIPGGYEIKDILERCCQSAANRQTKSAYKKGVEILSKDKVYCLKISDFNTKGVKSGRDEAWGALVYDVGKSLKQRPGAAGSHGVGKKVPFIISSCNTVYYSTKNKYKDESGCEKTDCLFEGKSTLINWTDSTNVRRSCKGWYGKINEDDSDKRNAVLPMSDLEISEVNPYFVRANEYGTDVIILGVNVYEHELLVKKHIINAVMENFFVAILNNLLKVTVFGEEVNAEKFHTIYEKWYEPSSDCKNELSDCIDVYREMPTEVKSITNKEGKEIGKVKIYFKLENRNNRKYYTVVRSHGMKIEEFRVNNAGQPYTAVVLVEGEEINTLLSSLENAAHDRFIDKDENMDIDEKAVYALNRMKALVAEYIKENTKINDTDAQEIEGLSNIITIPGGIVNVKKKKDKPVINRNAASKKSKGRPSNDYSKGRGTAGGNNKKNNSSNGHNKPAQEGGNASSILYDNYEMEPFIIKNGKDYILRLITKDDIKDAELIFSSINSEGKKDASIRELISKVTYKGRKQKCEKGKVKKISLKKGEQSYIVIATKRDVLYQLDVDVYYKGGDVNE